MKTIQNIVVSNTLPTNKNVLWVDTSKNTKQLKIFYNNVWTNALNNLSPKELASILEQSKQYTDEQIKELIGSAPEALNTLKELADAIGENEDVIDTLNKSVTNKQDKLVSGTNIKTINGESILGKGNLVLPKIVYVPNENSLPTPLEEEVLYLIGEEQYEVGE